MQTERYQVLNADEHGSLRVRTERSAELGDNLMHCMVFPGEFRNVQASYPILFQKYPDTGRFYALALFGFEEGENLFLGDSGWEPAYLPLVMQRQPLLIAFQRSAAADGRAPGDADKKAVISIDMESPRLSEDEGEALFLPHGGASEYLSGMSTTLERVHLGHQQSEQLCTLLEKYELLESFVLDVTLDSGAQHQLMGFYAINEEKLQNLGAEALTELQEKGALAPIFMAVASTSQFRFLIHRKNRRA
ncbi:MAG: SapC family protein [Halieaceae bacterium]|nr:SapC family protein [Halieaceae bacterium]